MAAGKQKTEFLSCLPVALHKVLLPRWGKLRSARLVMVTPTLKECSWTSKEKLRWKCSVTSLDATSPAPWKWGDSGSETTENLRTQQQNMKLGCRLGKPALVSPSLWASQNSEWFIHGTEWSKSEREKQILHINTYIRNLEKWYWWTYLQGRNRDADIENRCVNTSGEAEGGTNWEGKIEIYISMWPYIK